MLKNWKLALLGCVIAGAGATVSPAMADPWKDESGNGRWGRYEERRGFDRRHDGDRRWAEERRRDDRHRWAEERRRDDRDRWAEQRHRDDRRRWEAERQQAERRRDDGRRWDDARREAPRILPDLEALRPLLGGR
ncbi:hypothetical protein J8J14_16965 [Roseomonas sp. SSH11]|uniref:Uncharacterized protein n=1 Tax=Pararoseomonas baculiformis TaxID=2820812 RepID=A0ABS4AJS7_9PROT|nr:hypothetical protein [Pararoseomonas baculiformis]MBP0446469.1 hypothetical protein [Pararoseomonas baculiformis]